MALFSDITAANTTYKTGTIIVGSFVAGGLIYSLVKKKSFWGVVGYTIGFGIAGVAISMVSRQLTQK
jgi:hypothetical protein